MTSFAAAIIEWQRQFGRHDLPWQNTGDTYQIWLAEVMLQQTQVATVRPYFLRFIERFPDLPALAAAPIDDVMAAWAGLGYYSRARNLHRCAQVVVNEHGGMMPRTAAELEALPGIGRSTAAAIAVFAFGERAAILDGNVKRVFARHFGIEGAPGQAEVDRELWRIAERELPVVEVATYTQGLMDLGALVCVRARPQCDRCPVAASCRALAEGRTAELPTPRSRRLRPTRSATLIVLRDTAGAILLQRRPPAGIWGGMTSLPEFDSSLSDQALAEALERLSGSRVELGEALPPMQHDFTHFRFVMQPRFARIRSVQAAMDARECVWLSAAALSDAALPAPIRRLLRETAEGVTSESCRAS